MLNNNNHHLFVSNLYSSTLSWRLCIQPFVYIDKNIIYDLLFTINVFSLLFISLTINNVKDTCYLNKR